MRSHLFRKLLEIAFVYAVCSGTEIGKCPYCEHSSAQRPGQNRKSAPLGELSIVVGAGHLSVKPLVGEVVLGVARFAQVAYDIVGVHICDHSSEKDDSADDELR